VTRTHVQCIQYKYLWRKKRDGMSNDRPIVIEKEIVQDLFTMKNMARKTHIQRGPHLPTCGGEEIHVVNYKSIKGYVYYIYNILYTHYSSELL